MTNRMRPFRQVAGAILRNTAVLFIGVAEKVDPQPPLNWRYHLMQTRNANGLLDVEVTRRCDDA